MAATISVMTPFLSVAFISAMIAFFAMKSVNFMNARSSRDSEPLPPAFPGGIAEDRFDFRSAAPAPDRLCLSFQLVLQPDELALQLFQGDIEGGARRLLLRMDHEDRGLGRVQDDLRGILAVFFGR